MPTIKSPGLFKIKDLLVSYLPGANAAGCDPDTHCNGCTNQYSDCPGGCSNARSDFSQNCPEWRYDPADVEITRELLRYSQLRLELAQIEGRLLAAASADEQLREHLEVALQHVEEALPQAEKYQEADEVRLTSPAFRVHDLLITVVPRIPEGADSGCPGCTCVAGCSGGASGCTNASTHIEGNRWNEVVLPELRAALAAALNRTDAAPIGQALSAHSQHELEALAGQLKESIAVLDQTRQSLDDRPE